jgi:hypothetical protein
MKTFLFAALGLFTGAMLTTLLSTGCGDCPPYTPLPSGTFLPGSGTTAEADYKLEVSSDFKQVNETFTRGGKAYEVHYTVKSKEPL